MTNRRHARLEGVVLQRQYRVLQVIDKGGMGVVYEGLHEELKKRVALKVLSPKFGGQHRRFARFKREAESVASLSHPNVVQVFDFLTHQGLAVIVMEYVEGASFKNVLRNEGPLEAQRVVSIAAQVLSALEATHAAKIVHRDLKPGNVILTSVPGLGEWVKVVDFGISLMLEETGATRLTQHGEVLGTPAFMAPEQILGEPVDRRADIYSLGAMMFKALSGRVPYAVRSFRDLLQALVEQPAPTVEALTPYASLALSHIVVRALSKDPIDRFDTAEEMASALRAATEVEEETTLPPPHHAGPELASERLLSATVRAVSVRDLEKPSDHPATTLDLGEKGYRPNHEDPVPNQGLISSHERPKSARTEESLGGTRNLRPPASRQSGKNQETPRNGDSASRGARQKGTLRIVGLVTTVLVIIALGSVAGHCLHRSLCSGPSSPQPLSIQEQGPTDPALQPKVVQSPLPILPVTPPVQNLQPPPEGLIPSRGTLKTFLFDALKRATKYRPNARLAAIHGNDIDSGGWASSKTDRFGETTSGSWSYIFCDPDKLGSFQVMFSTNPYVRNLSKSPLVTDIHGHYCEPLKASASTLPDSDRVMQEFMRTPGCPRKSGETLFNIFIFSESSGDAISVDGSFRAYVEGHGDLRVDRPCH